VRISVVRPKDLGEGELSAWRDFQMSDPAFENPFLCPEFALAVGDQRPAARVAVLEDGDGVAGFLPFEARRLGVGKPIGSGLCDYQAVLHRPGLEWDPRALLAGCGLSVFEFDHLSAQQEPFVPHHAAVVPAPAMDLSRGFDAFIGDIRRRSRGFVKTTRRLQRKMERELGPLEMVYDDPRPEAHELVLAWKSAQYRRTGRPDLFGRGEVRDLVHDLLHRREGEFSCVCTTLSAGGRLVSGQINLHSPTMIASWVIAYDPGVAAYSPGGVHDLLLAEEAARRGIGLISLGKGESMQKGRLGTTTRMVAEGWVERPSVVSAMRRAVRTPARAARDYVLRTPRLRSAVRRGLRAAGSLRRGRSPLPPERGAHPGPQPIRASVPDRRGPFRY
jgi:CelD/BcsL family acetyltransferase involved in cellulose biosynthesis